MIVILILALLGALIGAGLGILIFSKKNDANDNQAEKYLGGLPVVGVVGALLLAPQLPITLQAAAFGGLIVALALLGLIRDVYLVQYNVILPYLILIFIIGAIAGIQIDHPVRAIEVALTVLWPIIIVHCLKFASLVFEMPFILCLESGLTFILFFAGQVATPPWAVIFTLGLIVVTALFLVPVLFQKRVTIGNSGIFALGYLLAGISMMGCSKSLLMFGLLIPSMVTIFPLLMISFLIITSYIGNELYQVNSPDRQSHYDWDLSRERVIVFGSLLFLSLNFAGLFLSIQASWAAYVALLILFTASIASFVKTFARRKSILLSASSAKFKILGQSVDIISSEETISRISDFLHPPKDTNDNAPNVQLKAEVTKGVFHVITADSLALLRAHKEPDFARIMARASLVVPDGAGLSWAADFLGSPTTSRVPGVGLVSQLCEQAAQKDWRVYFLGAAPGVAEKAAQALVEKFPKLLVAGTQSGFFHEGSEAEQAILQEIREKNPQILFVALGVPKQEQFINRMNPFLPPLVAIGVGGSFDVISGSIPRAPVIMQKFALEWLFRLWLEPRRFNRILMIPEFVIAILRTKWDGNTKDPQAACRDKATCTINDPKKT